MLVNGLISPAGLPQKRAGFWILKIVGWGHDGMHEAAALRETRAADDTIELRC